jgi:hypothetical protein
MLATSRHVLHDPTRQASLLLIQQRRCLLGSFHARFTMIESALLIRYRSQRYWLVGGVIWIYERILREVRSRHRTYISKVIQHPSKVVELQIKKDKTTTRAGQYIFICCPEVSYFQWHPFTLTR